MGLREEIAKVRLARSRLEITRAKLKKLDEDQERLERMRLKAQPKPPRRRRRGFELD